MVQNVRERNIQVQKVWGETSSVQTVQLKKVRGAKRPGPKSQGAKHLGPKYQEAKRPGPKREGRNVQDLNVRMRNDLVRIVRERNVQDLKKAGGETSWWAQNVQVQKVRGRNFVLSPCTFMLCDDSGTSYTSWSKMSCSDMSRAKISGGETSWSKTSGGRNVLVQNVRGWNIQVQNVRGRNVLSKMSGGETSCPKCQGVKRPGPKRLSPDIPGAKTLPDPSLHGCETSSMIVTLPEASLWLWGSFIIII